jgi:CBS domain-containing protein
VLQDPRPPDVVNDRLAGRADDPSPAAPDSELADSIDRLAALRPAREQAFGALVRAGVDAYDLGRSTAETNDRLVRWVLRLVEEELGPPPLAYCWLGLGSVGRREQTLNTDLDTALVYADPPPEGAAAAGRYYAELAERTVAGLERCGFARCEGGIMASNPEWRRPLVAWRDRVDRWVRRPDPDALYNAAIFFDLRPVAGDSSLGEQLWAEYLRRVPESSLFVHLLMRGALIHRPPLGLFGNFVVERSGAHRGAFDIKMHGLMPVVEATRASALARDITRTNTFERLWALRDSGAASRRDTDELIAAYDFVARLRVRHQIDQLAAGQPVDNFINPDELSRDDRAALKEHFKVIRDLAGLIER